MTGSAKKDTDTVRAMLTPGEAVLTVAAAERVGRKNIAMLNKTSGKKTRRYAEGTSNVADVGGKEFAREQNNFQLMNRVTKSEANSDDFQNAAKAKLQKMDGGAGYAKGTSKVAKPKKTEPAKKPRKYDDGTSKVIKDDYSKEDFANDAQYQSDKNDYDDKSQNQHQGPTPLNLSNMRYAQKNGEKTIWNGPTGKRDTPSYSKGTAKVPQPRMSKVDRVVDRLFKK